MSENTINTLIAVIGSLLGGIIGAYATIRAAKIAHKLPDTPSGEKPKSSLKGIITGAATGAIITLTECQRVF